MELPPTRNKPIETWICFSGDCLLSTMENIPIVQFFNYAYYAHFQVFHRDRKSSSQHLEPQTVPFINGCFNWMIPNLYIENGWKSPNFHPFYKMVGLGVPGIVDGRSKNRSFKMERGSTFSRGLWIPRIQITSDQKKTSQAQGFVNS